MIWFILQGLLGVISQGIVLPHQVPPSTLIPSPEILEQYQQQESQTVVHDEFFHKPAYIIIPSIGVNAAIVSVGLTDEGAVDSPKDPAWAGWFEKGPLPGERGSTIIDGHRGWRNKTPAIFDRLHEIQLDDYVIIIDEEGNTLTYRVYALKTYDPNESPDEVFAPSTTSLLNLITCNGEWDFLAQTATKRLVVFTQRVEL